MTTLFALATTSRARRTSSAASGMKRLLVEHVVECRLEPALHVIGQRCGSKQDAIEQARGQIAELFGGLDFARLRAKLELGRKRARHRGVDRLAHELRFAAVDAHRLRRAHALEVAIEQK